MSFINLIGAMKNTSSAVISIDFKEISDNPSDKEILFLYDLLKERQYTISHKEMPSHNDHIKQFHLF